MPRIGPPIWVTKRPGLVYVALVTLGPEHLTVVAQHASIRIPYRHKVFGKTLVTILSILYNLYMQCNLFVEQECTVMFTQLLLSSPAARCRCKFHEIPWDLFAPSQPPWLGIVLQRYRNICFSMTILGTRQQVPAATMLRRLALLKIPIACCTTLLRLRRRVEHACWSHLFWLSY